MRTVAHLMHPDPITVPQDAPVQACAALMARTGVRHLPVVDAEGRLCGLVTDDALFGLEVDFDPQAPCPEPESFGVEGLEARDVARPARVVCRQDARFCEALQALARQGEDIAVVQDANGRPVGVLTEHDALQVAAELLPLDLQARAIAARDPPALGPQATRVEGLVALEATGRRHLLVMEGDRLLGVLSARDLARSGRPITLEGADSPFDRVDGCRIGALLAGPPVVADQGIAARAVARTMADRAIGCMPLVDTQGRVVGALTRSQIVAALCTHLRASAQRAGA